MKRLVAIGTAAVAVLGTCLAASAADAYIESDGTQFMNTGYHPSGKTKIAVDFQLTSTASSKDCVFGNYGDSKFSILLYANPTVQSGQFQFCGKDGGWSPANTGVSIDTERHTMVIDVPKKKGTMLAADGTVQNVVDFGSWTYKNESNWPLALFASCNNVSGTTARQGACVKIYGAKIWESDDNGESYELVHDYAPAVKSSITGLVDTVTGTFLWDTRASAGAFAGGGDIQEIEDDPYIESNGTSAINTGVVASPDLKIEIDYMFTDASDPNPESTGNHWQQRLFGQDTVSSTPRISMYINNAQRISLSAGDEWAAVSSGVRPDDFVRRTAIIDCPAEVYAIMTGVTTNWSNTTACTNITKCATRPLALFGNTSNDAGTTFSGLSKAKVYGLRIWAGETLIRDFAPRCIDGVAGFEDLVTGRFYTCTGLTASANAATALSGSSREGDAFIESDGSLYSVVDTRYFVNPNTKVEIDYQLASYVSSGIVMGGFGADAGVTTILWCRSTSEMVLEMKDGNHDSTANGLISPQIAPDLARHTAVFDGPGRHMSLKKPDGTIESEADFHSSWTLNNTAKWPMLLFGSADSAYGKSKQRAKARIYGVKVYENGEVVHKFTPFVKGGVAGFKDEKTGSFFSGDGLTAGGNVQEADDDPYVESPTGGRYFDTGVYATSNTAIVCDFMLLVQQSGQQFPFEAGDSISATNANQKMYMRMYGNGSAGTGDYAFACGGELFTSMAVPYSPLSRRRVTLDAYNLVCKVETPSGLVYREKEISAKGRSPNKSSSTIKLLCNGNMNGNSCKARLYGVKIYEEGSLIRDYVPICQGGEYALLDKVQGKVLSKASNSSAFTGSTGNDALNDAFFYAANRAEDAYIESDGTQAIGLGYYTKPTTRYEVDFAMTEINGQYRIFGATGNQPAELYISGNATGSGAPAFGFGDTWKGHYANNDVSDTNRHLAVADLANHEWGYSGFGTGMKKMDASVTITKTGNMEMAVFGKANSTNCSSDGNVIYRSKVKLYAFRIFEAGTLVHEYLPYKNGNAVGLYDTMTGEVKQNVVSGGNAFTYGGGLGYGKYAGARRSLVVAPTSTTVGANSPRTLVAFAPGAVKYKWTRNGEVVAGEDGDTLTVAWRKAKTPDTYTVTPVFLVNGEETEGESSAVFTVENLSQGTMIVLQ